jgi:hypothetical protein
MRVLQLKEPVAFRYSEVNQKVILLANSKWVDRIGLIETEMTRRPRK